MTSEIKAIQVAIDFEISAAPEVVWAAMLEDTTQWWLDDFLGSKNSHGIFFEAKPGGRLYEESPTGGLLWYTIIELDAPRTLAMSGNMAPPYGGPATSMLRISLAESRIGCQLSLTDHIFGVVDETTPSTIQSGWRELFQVGLKNYIEQS